MEVWLDGVSDRLGSPGVHPFFFCGSFDQGLCARCRLFDTQPPVV